VIERLRGGAAELGLVWGGVAPAVESAGFSKLVEWIETGYAGDMHYFADRLDAYRHPAGVLDGVRSIVVLGIPYRSYAHQSVDSPHLDPPSGDGSYLPVTVGRIARYAHGETDYHDTIHPKLKQLCRLLDAAAPGSRSRGVIDTAPLMEREVAVLAGFGWQGKNTLLLNKQLGSYFFLACVLTTADLPIAAPHDTDHCGTCTACIDACPTDAFPQPGLLDATRCISYLTIEHRGPIASELRGGIGHWLFGCDVCQEVCPWNTKPARRSAAAKRERDSIELYDLFDLTDDQFRRRFRHTPLWRPRRRGILRNAAIVLGNSMCKGHLPALVKGLQDQEPLVRGASAWALGRSASSDAKLQLASRLGLETDERVRHEISIALANHE